MPNGCRASDLDTAARCPLPDNLCAEPPGPTQLAMPDAWDGEEWRRTSFSPAGAWDALDIPGGEHAAYAAPLPLRMPVGTRSPCCTRGSLRVLCMHGCVGCGLRFAVRCALPVS